MALVNTGLVDDNFKVIKVITGKKNEDELIVEVEKLKGSTNESKISVANVYYEVVNEKVNNVEQCELLAPHTHHKCLVVQ